MKTHFDEHTQLIYMLLVRPLCTQSHQGWPHFLLGEMSATSETSTLIEMIKLCVMIVLSVTSMLMSKLSAAKNWENKKEIYSKLQFTRLNRISLPMISIKY